MAACYVRAAELAGWGRRLPADTGLGIAGLFSLGTYAAVVMEASVDVREGLEIVRAWGAVDRGIGGQRGEARAESGTTEAQHAELANAVSAGGGDGGRRRGRRGAAFEVELEAGGCVRVARRAGELPAAPAAAALANAVHAACGQRIRSLATGGADARRAVYSRRSRSTSLETRQPRRARRREREGGGDERFR